MAKFQHKTEQTFVEALTFDELVTHGLKECDPNSIHMGMPWHFKLGEHSISHENDSCYIIPTPHLYEINQATSHFTPNEILLIGVVGELTPISKEYFEENYLSVSE